MSRRSLADAVRTRREQLKDLPTRPGVYMFRDETGAVSTSARRSRCARACARTSRRAAATGRRSRSCPSASRDVEVIVTQHEVEALHLEQNLVKRHRPPFNVRLRDDKSFPYIAVTVGDDSRG